MRTKSYHLIGVGGIGMSALARILLQSNQSVSGSDLNHSSLVSCLEEEGVHFLQGHDRLHVSSGSTVVYSSAVKESNPEYQEALSQNLCLMHRSDLLIQLMEGKQCLSVAGTHGKTSTSALLTAVLIRAGLDPSYAVGGMIQDFGKNGAKGTGHYFVAEADESDGTFVKFPSYGAIVTNCEKEHLDHYKSLDSLYASFVEFIEKVQSKEHLFLCGEDKVLKALYDGSGIRYGFSKDCSLRAQSYRQEAWKCFFDIHYQGHIYKDVELSLSGKHNVLNALAVFGLCLHLGVPVPSILEVFRSFKGVSRRMETVVESSGVKVIDDYAHHPTEVASTLQAVRAACEEKRMIAVFQPHRYTRTQDCMEQFPQAFSEADILIVTDVYAAGECMIEAVSGRVLAQNAQKELSIPCIYFSRQQLRGALFDLLQPHDVLVMMGAGDISSVARQLGADLLKKETKRLVVGLLKGGSATEHEVSLQSAKNVSSALNGDLYSVKSFVINKEGRWSLGDRCSYERFSSEVIQELMVCDIFFPVLHGPFGEDGVLQGFLESLGKPFVGCSHRSSAICMDKAITKKLAQHEGIKTANFVDFDNREWNSSPDKWLEKISPLSFPLFVKPSHLGSSVAVTKVSDKEGLVEALHQVFMYDTHVVIEEEVQGRELEFAVLGNDKVEVAGPGEICCEGQVYDYEKKYGSHGAPTELWPELDPKVAAQGCELAKRVYKLCLCTGLARVDFFLDEEGQYWLNEVNSIPGFTSISLYPKLWEERGMSTQQLLDRLIILGLHQHRYLKTRGQRL